MPNLKKVPLKSIAVIPMVNPRDLDTESKARGAAIESLRSQLKGSIKFTATNSMKLTKGGYSVDKAVKALTVAPIPKDLPEEFDSLVKDKDWLLVDGFIRFEAIREAMRSQHGDDLMMDVRVGIEELSIDSMNGIMREALERNLKNCQSLSTAELKQCIFRMMLCGGLTGSIDSLYREYGHLWSRSTLAEYKKVADYWRDTLGLNEKAPDEVRDALEQAIEDEKVSLYLSVDRDGKGFPSKGALSELMKARKSGDTETYLKNRQESRVERDDRIMRAGLKASEQLKRLPPEEALLALKQQVAILREELDNSPKAGFVDPPKEFAEDDYDEF